MRKAKKRQARYADRKTKAIDFEVGDPVYYRNNQRKGKLDIKWKPFYRIIEKRGPVTYIFKNQLDGSTSKVHAEMLRLANIEDWNISNNAESRRLRDAAYVIPPKVSDSGSDSDSDSEMNTPLAELAKRYRRERDNSDSEDDIPLTELAKRLRARESVNNPNQETENLKDSEDVDMTSEFSSDDMRVDTVRECKKTERKHRHKKNESEIDKYQIMKMILERL